MIRSFADLKTGRFWKHTKSKEIPAELRKRARRKLTMLDNAVELRDLASPPGNRLEKLHGDREGQHSIRINDQFRICFRWEKGDAYDVEIADYH